MAFIHRFGALLNAHVHFHCVVVEGVSRPMLDQFELLAALIPPRRRHRHPSYGGHPMRRCARRSPRWQAAEPPEAAIHWSGAGWLLRVDLGPSLTGQVLSYGSDQIQGTERQQQPGKPTLARAWRPCHR
jgi:hypothetical protein